MGVLRGDTAAFPVPSSAALVVQFGAVEGKAAHCRRRECQLCKGSNRKSTQAALSD